MKNFNNVYIPTKHEKYDVLPTCRKFNAEVIICDHNLLDKIQKSTNMPDHMVSPYNYESYEDYFNEIDNWINKFPNCKQEIIDYKDSVIKLNNKDLWAIVKYVGESNFSFTKNKYYYFVMYIENNSWVVHGIIDNEEEDAFLSWSSKCTDQVDLIKDFEIIIDPSNNLASEFTRIMENLSK